MCLHCSPDKQHSLLRGFPVFKRKKKKKTGQSPSKKWEEIIMVEVWNLTKNLFGNFQNKRECVDMEETKEEEPSAFVPTATLF